MSTEVLHIQRIENRRTREADTTVLFGLQDIEESIDKAGLLFSLDIEY
jgi:hypothetical protein